MGIIQTVFGSYPTSDATIWTVPFSSFASATSSDLTISNLQIGDIVFVAFVDGSEDQDDIDGWATFLGGGGDPESSWYFRKAIVDTSFTIEGSRVNDANNYAVIVVRSSKNTITVLEQVFAIRTSSSGFPTIPSTNFLNAAIPSLSHPPFALAIGYSEEDDITTSGAPSSDWTYLDISASSGTSIVGAYSTAASSGDTAPPGAGNSFTNTGGNDENETYVLYASTENRTVKTWSVVDSVFQDIEDDGRGLTVNNLQQGDFLYWTQAGDSAGSIATASGWSSTFSEDDNDPSFKEQVRVVGSGETTVSVTCDFDVEVGALIAFRCSSGTTSLESGAYAISREGSSGNPVVPTKHDDGTSVVPRTSQDDCLCVVSGYLDDDDISSCTAPSGLTLAGFAGGNRFFGLARSSLMVAYGVSRAQEAGPLAGGRSFTTNGSDEWDCTAWYINPS